MRNKILSKEQVNLWQRNIPNILVFLLLSLMFSRILTSVLGLPKIIDFVHFFIAAISFIFFLASSPKLLKQARVLLILLFLLLISIILSAAWSGAGIGNVIFDFLIVGEPFMVLIMLISYSWKTSDIIMLKKFILLILLTHIAISYFEFLILGEWHDAIEGLFQGMGAGGHIGGAVALIGGGFFFRDKQIIKKKSIRYGLLFLSLGIIFITDSKQVIAVLLLAMLIVIFIGAISAVKKLKYLFWFLIISIMIILFFESFLSSYSAWLKKDLLLSGLSQKLSVFSIIISYFNSPLDYLLGHGPGHTVGKLAFMIPSYYDFLSQFKISTSPITSEVWIANQANYMSNSITGSSIFMLFYLWPSLFGDLGLFGLFVYLSILWRLLFCISKTLFSKFITISIMGFASVFTWVEEPQFIVFIMLIIGIIWQEQNTKTNSDTK